MNAEIRYRINEPNVTSEEIDGEVIIVNLLNGNYYSALDLAAVVWNRIVRSHSLREISDELVARYPDQTENIDADLAEFLEKVTSEFLVVGIDGTKVTNGANSSSSNSISEFPDSYCTPVLTSYSDMQDLLLLDPVHDVSEVGWPTAKPASDG